LTCLNCLQFWATVTNNGSPYATIPMSCPVLSVCNVGVLWPNGWMDRDATWYGGRRRPRRHCIRLRPSSLYGKGQSSHPTFRSMSIVAKRGCPSQQLLSSCSPYTPSQVWRTENSFPRTSAGLSPPTVHPTSETLRRPWCDCSHCGVSAEFLRRSTVVPSATPWETATPGHAARTFRVSCRPIIAEATSRFRTRR